MSRAHYVVFAALVFACGAPALAQAVAAPPAPVPSAPYLPFVEPARQLNGGALVEALRRGGYVLYMRHGFASIASSACPNESDLNDEGMEQARMVGAALRKLKVPVGAVQASNTCRARDTARLLAVGAVSINSDLNPATMRPPVDAYDEQFKYLLQVPAAGSNLVLVAHIQGASEVRDRILIDYAEVVVYRSIGKGRSEPLARIPLGSWSGLLAAAEKLP